MSQGSPRPKRAGMRAFVRNYTAGMSGEDLRRLFDRDAVQAFKVLTRDQETIAARPRGRFRRFLLSVRLAFLGISYKLTPARRAVFGGAVICALLGLLDLKFQSNSAGTTVSVTS